MLLSSKEDNFAATFIYKDNYRKINDIFVVYGYNLVAIIQLCVVVTAIPSINTSAFLVRRFKIASPPLCMMTLALFIKPGQGL